jgi:hypothetical protein
MDRAVGCDITPAAIRLRLPLEGKPLRVMDVPELDVVVVLKVVGTSPCSAYVITILIVSVSMELRNDVLESSKD